MDLFQAIFMGIVQGLSEFLPISSSGHIVFSSNIYKFINGMVDKDYIKVITDKIMKKLAQICAEI